MATAELDYSKQERAYRVHERCAHLRIDRVELSIRSVSMSRCLLRYARDHRRLMRHKFALISWYLTKSHRIALAVVRLYMVKDNQNNRPRAPCEQFTPAGRPRSTLKANSSSACDNIHAECDALHPRATAHWPALTAEWASAPRRRKPHLNYCSLSV